MHHTTLLDGVRDLPLKTGRRLAVRSTRLAFIAFLLLVVLSVFLVSLTPLCVNIGFYLQNGGQFSSRELLERPTRNLQSDSDFELNDAAELLTDSDLGKAEHLTLKLMIDERTVRGTYVLSGPGDRIDLLSNTMRAFTDSAVDQLFGSVTVNGNKLGFNQIELDPNSTNDVSTLVTQSGSVPRSAFLDINLDPPPKTKHLLFAAKDIVLNSKVPLEQAIGLSNLSRTQNPNTFRITDAKTVESHFEIELSQQAQASEQPLATMMERSGLLKIPFAGDLAETLLWAVPYLLLLLLVVRVSPEDIQPYRKVVLLVLLLECGVTFLQATRFDLGSVARTFTWIQLPLMRLTSSQEQIRSLYQQPISFAVVLFAGILWPNLVHRVMRPNSPLIPRRTPRKISAIIVASLASAALATVLIAQTTSSVPLICMALLLGLFVITLFWLLWEFFGFWEAVVKAILGGGAAAILGLCVGLPNFVNAHASYHWAISAVAIGISVLVGTRISVAFLNLSTVLLQNVYLDFLVRHKWIALAFVLVLCSPASWIQNPSSIYWEDVGSLIYLFRDLFILAVIVSVMKFLQRLDEQNIWPSLTVLDLDCGVALAITAFFSSTSVWFYFPIPLITGFVLLRWFLFVEPEQVTLASKLNADWKRLIHSVLALQRAEKLEEDVQKGLKDKLTKAEIEFADYQSRLAAVTGDAQRQRELLTVDGWPVDRLLFSYGTANSAWMSGCNAALYSLVFALPWIVLSIRDLLKERSWVTYLLLYFLSSTVMIIARWALYGFFFGYFYAYLRGHNGLQKALAFWFTLVVPSVLASVLAFSLDKQSLAPLLFWAAEMFLHCMLLGLIIGELQPLWKADLSWRQLLDFHKVTGLSVWGSSFLLALGAAVTTALSSGLGALINQGLKFVGVLPAK
jgi:hypothetical protein